MSSRSYFPWSQVCHGTVLKWPMGLTGFTPTISWSTSPQNPTVSSTATSSCSWSISRALQVTRVPCAQLPGRRTVVRGSGKCLQDCGTGLHEARWSAYLHRYLSTPYSVHASRRPRADLHMIDGLYLCDFEQSTSHTYIVRNANHRLCD